MEFAIFENGEHINTIVAGEAFCAAYCKQNGYTYEQVSTQNTEAESTAQADIEAMLIDHEYRLILLELGITEEEV